MSVTQLQYSFFSNSLSLLLGQLRPLVVTFLTLPPPNFIISHCFHYLLLLLNLLLSLIMSSSLFSPASPESHASQKPLHGDYGRVSPSQKPRCRRWCSSQPQWWRSAAEHQRMHKEHLHCEFTSARCDLS